MRSRFPKRPPPNLKTLVGVKMSRVTGDYAHDPHGQLYVLNAQSGWVPVRGGSKAYRAYVDARKRVIRARLGRRAESPGEFDRWNDEERALRKREGKAKYRRRKKTRTRRRR